MNSEERAPDEPESPGQNDVKEETKRKRPLWRELPVLLVIAFVAALLIKTFLLQAFFIPSASMEPTLKEGDRVLVEKVFYRFGEPDRPDVIVFERDLPGLTGTDAEDESVFSDIANAFKELFGFPTGTTEDYIKRVIGVEGDTVSGRDGRVFVNGEAIDEPYLPEDVETAPFESIEVPQDMIFVMGDNRGASDDSRSFGPISVDSVIGRAFVIVWPPSDFSGL
ncbi:MAG TPA: signal peptidase I [Actinomycetota bacterium]|nr:signal peptidase I [Actinomycetota bacterium]